MFIYLLALLSCLNLYSKPFANNFVEMNIPDDWDCSIYSGDQWTCYSKDATKVKDAVVVMSFANATPEDTMQSFYNYLNGSLTITDPKTGKKGKSVPKNNQYKQISGQTWVDSQHLSYAVPNYYTRFLATTKDGRAVLVSITVDKNKYAMYMTQLYKMVESIKLRMTAPAAPMETGLAGLFGTKLKTVDNKAAKVATAVPVEQKSSKWRMIISLLVGVIVFIIAFRYFRKKMKAKANKKPGGYFK